LLSHRSLSPIVSHALTLLPSCPVSVLVFFLMLRPPQSPPLFPYTTLFRSPAVDPRALHALGDRLYGTDPAPLAAFVDTVNAWLSLRLTAGEEAPARRARLAEVWEKVNAAARDADTFNLERKPLVFNVFSWLAEASRG